MGNSVWQKNAMCVKEQALTFVQNAMETKHSMAKPAQNVMAEASSNAMPAAAEGLSIE